MAGENPNDQAAEMLADLTKKHSDLLVERTNLEAEVSRLKSENAKLSESAIVLSKDAKKLETAKNKAEKELDLLKKAQATEAKPQAVKHSEPVAFGGKKYEILLPQINIPGIGVRTAMEIATEEEQTAIEALVASESGCIKEVQ